VKNEKSRAMNVKRRELGFKDLKFHLMGSSSWWGSWSRIKVFR